MLLMYPARRDDGDGGMRRRLPPSPPWGLPLLGHLHLLGALPHRALRSLAAAHGPVLLLRLGRVPVVVVSSAAAAEELFDDFVELLGQEPMGELLPWLGWVDALNGMEVKVQRTFEALDGILEKVIDDHRRRRREVGRQMDDGGGGDHRDFVDVLLDVNETDMDAGVQLGTIEIKAIILDMFAAGTDTTMTVIEWAMAELITHPDAMRNAQDEIKAVVGITSHITEDHLDRLPYLKAVLKETLRLHPPLPLLVPHEPSSDTKILGYSIPARTRIVINAWTIGRDQATWGEHAEEFIPERFLESGLDYIGQDFVLVPFGAGRRGCPGVGFAVQAMEMALASLLYNFDWETRVVDRRSEFGTSSLDMSEMNGLSVRLNNQTLSVARTRAKQWPSHSSPPSLYSSPSSRRSCTSCCFPP
uniref:Cytochrome P450 71A1 n=1 Tax=Oryza rufipogon TaxID=4529 RepID=A0A0E0MTE3_ORYRU